MLPGDRPVAPSLPPQGFHRVAFARAPGLPVPGALRSCAVARWFRAVPRRSPSLAPRGFLCRAHFVPVPSLGGFAQFPAGRLRSRPGDSCAGRTSFLCRRSVVSRSSPQVAFARAPGFPVPGVLRSCAVARWFCAVPRAPLGGSLAVSLRVRVAFARAPGFRTSPHLRLYRFPVGAQFPAPLWGAPLADSLRVRVAFARGPRFRTSPHLRLYRFPVGAQFPAPPGTPGPAYLFLDGWAGVGLTLTWRQGGRSRVWKSS
ncbi:hypothetical protein YW7DRAFT_01546 [Streptomyces sp. AmelKG-E11A]|nr:hypothetical protein YW7DRAFT_01546 [Streptomyces sp. AmelKG-E11A]